MHSATLTRLAFVSAALLATTVVSGQAQNAGRNLNVIAVNQTNHEIYTVSFAPPGGSTTIGNTDGSNYVRPEALAFVVNVTTNQLDLLVADNQRGTIYRYPGAFAPQSSGKPTTTGTLVWNSQSEGTGPVAPSAMAVDAFGNLIVANSTAGHSKSSELWMFPVGTSGSGSFGRPVLIDNDYPSKTIIQEVTFVPYDVTGATGVNGGDLIVLTSSAVLDYPVSSTGTSATYAAPPITLLSFANGNPVPAGMDFWTFGNGGAANYSLLISNSGSSTISRYYFTNPLTAAPAFATGLNTPYRVKTLFQAGTPLLFVSENGAILEFGASPDGSGSGTLLATVTQNVVDPQGLAVSNAFTNALSLCQQPGGCDLTGLLDHQVTNAPPLTGNIVENVCTRVDPRVSMNPNWSCSATPLLVNAVCPGFDDTGTMQIPDTMCGHSGTSNAGFSLIKTLVTVGQFQSGTTEAYIENAAVLADGSNPACGNSASGVDGAFLWAPLKAEGTVLETPNMLDITSGCGSIHGGSAGVSVWAVGMSVNEAAPELQSPLMHPLENLAQGKYTNLTSTIKSMTVSGNITSPASGELWAGNVPPAHTFSPPGCLDNSWQLYYNATQVDTDGSQQQTADLQNAANWLTNADAVTNTTCDSVVTFNPADFIQTTSPVVFNPAGQVRSRLANLYYSVNTRLVLNTASGEWPAPIMVNVVPTTAMIGKTTPTLSWNATGGVSGGDSGCTLNTTPNPTTLTGSSGQVGITAPAGAGLVQYTVSCTAGPGAGASTPWGLSASAWINWVQQPTLSLSPATVLQGSTAQLTYNTGDNTGCTLQIPGASPTPVPASTANTVITVSAAGVYALSCPAPAAAVSPVTLAVVQQPTLTPPTVTIVSGTSTMLTYNAGGSSNCTLTGPGVSLTGLSGNTNTQVSVSSAGTYTLSCPSPAGSVSATVTAVQQPTLTPATVTILTGTSTNLTYNPGGSSGCTLTGPGVNLTGLSGSTNAQVSVSSAGTYTLSCPSPAGSVSAKVTVVPPPAISAPSSITAGSPVTVSWSLNSSSGCSLSSSDGKYTNSSLPNTQPSVTYTPTVKAPGSITYTLKCTTPSASSTSATVSVTAPPATTVKVSPGKITDDAQKATINWTAPSGASGCTLTDSSTYRNGPGGSLSGQTSSSGGGSFIAYYTSGEPDGGFTLTFKASCASGATSSTASLSVTE